MNWKLLLVTIFLLSTLILAGCGQVNIPDVTAEEMQTRILDGKPFITENGAVIGDPIQGALLYVEHCQDCHGEDGTDENFGDDANPVYLGTSAKRDALAFFRVTNFGDAARKMPGFYEDATLTQLIDVVAYAQSLAK